MSVYLISRNFGNNFDLANFAFPRPFLPELGAPLGLPQLNQIKPEKVFLTSLDLLISHLQSKIVTARRWSK